MTITSASTPITVLEEPADDALDYAIRDYVRTYVCGMAGPRPPRDSASPATPCGAAWSMDAWGNHCPGR